MDKSRQYIRMCCQASEIQRNWKQQYGDFFVADNNQIQCWLPALHGSLKVRRGFAIRGRQGVIELCRYSWLPRMDQLIELAQEYSRDYNSITLEFYSWTRNPYPHQQTDPVRWFKTMEKVWLTFVMHKNYGKVWHQQSWQKQPYKR
jgi:hypothetical protein